MMNQRGFGLLLIGIGALVSTGAGCASNVDDDDANESISDSRDSADDSEADDGHVGISESGLCKPTASAPRAGVSIAEKIVGTHIYCLSPQGGGETVAVQLQVQQPDGVWVAAGPKMYASRGGDMRLLSTQKIFQCGTVVRLPRWYRVKVVSNQGRTAAYGARSSLCPMST